MIRRHSLGSAFSRAFPLLALALPIATAYAQQTQQYPVGKIWVDPNYGSNSNAGTVNAPVQSITHALTLCNPIPAPFTDMVIMLKPGVYKDQSQGGAEILLDFTQNPPRPVPLRMTKNTSLQGTNAVNTIIRGLEQSGAVTLQFEADVLNEYNRVFVDGINLHKGETGVLIINDSAHPFASRPTFSNCFITDFRHYGVQIVSSPNGSSLDEVACSHPALPSVRYIVHRPKFLNCTFRFNRHSIMNCTSETRFGHPDDAPLLGVSQPGLLNVLSADSKIDGVPKHDFVGIDHADVDVDGFGTSCIFESADPRGLFNPTLTNCTTLAATPQPLFTVSTVLADGGVPLFVEDVVGNPLPLAIGWDLRLNPQMYTLNTNFSPIDVGFLPTGNTVSWSNGTTANLKLTKNGLDYYKALDLDCEGFGNVRVASSGLIDVGADELGELVTAGYRQLSTMYQSGDTIYRWAGPGASGPLPGFNLIAGTPGYPPVHVDANTYPYACKPPQTVNGYTISGLSGLGYIAQNVGNHATYGGFDPVLPAPQVAITPINVYVNEQVVSPGSVMSNLQSFTVLKP